MLPGSLTTVASRLRTREGVAQAGGKAEAGRMRVGCQLQTHPAKPLLGLTQPFQNTHITDLGPPHLGRNIGRLDQRKPLHQVEKQDAEQAFDRRDAREAVIGLQFLRFGLPAWREELEQLMPIIVGADPQRGLHTSIYWIKSQKAILKLALMPCIPLS